VLVLLLVLVIDIPSRIEDDDEDDYDPRRPFDPLPNKKPTAVCGGLTSGFPARRVQTERTGPTAMRAVRRSRPGSRAVAAVVPLLFMTGAI
jgi:hypothetical protein